MAVESPKPELISEALQLATTLTEQIYNNVGELQGKSVAFTGSGPYLNSDLKLLLPGHIETIDIDEISEPESTVGLVVVGREDFDEPGLEVCVKSIQSTINFLPQEGFLTRLKQRHSQPKCRNNPYCFNPSVKPSCVKFKTRFPARRNASTS